MLRARHVRIDRDGASAGRMSCRSAAGNMDVGAWFVVTVLLLAALVWLVRARRQAARRAAVARARARSRRYRPPLVSANVRGQVDQKADIWREEQEATTRDGRAA